MTPDLLPAPGTQMSVGKEANESIHIEKKREAFRALQVTYFSLAS